MLMEPSKLDITGFAAILAGIIFLATGVLMFINATNTLPDPLSSGVIRLLGVITALVGAILLASRDE